jgi:hypothetical protein
MTEIIEAVDAWVLSRYGGQNLKQFGYCEIMRKSFEGGEEVFPVGAVTRERVQILDKHNIVTWAHWITPANYEKSSEWSFGKTEAREATAQIRYLFAHKTTLGENLINDFVNAFPNKLTVSGYQFVFVDPAITVDPDHEQIHNSEFGNSNYEKHRFTWNIYAINITVQFLLCEATT